MGVEWVWLGVVLGSATLVGWVLWWGNEEWYVVPVKAKCSGTKLPPGHMGISFLGEMITFLMVLQISSTP